MVLKRFITALLLFVAFYTNAQVQPKLDDFGRIVLNTYISDKASLPQESKQLLQNKLNQIATAYGMGGSSANPRFILTASINIGTKDIIAGPPQMVAQNVDITFFIGDAIEDKIFSNSTVSLKGVGTNENKAFIDALKKINPKNKNLALLIEEGKNKIIAYYNTQCDFITEDAKALSNQGKYQEAIYKLSLVPEVCKECYFNSLSNSAVIYQKLIDAEGKEKLTQAKALWASNQNYGGAEKALELTIQINPSSSSYPDVAPLIKSIQTKLASDDRERFRLQERQAQRNHQLTIINAREQSETERTRITAYRDIAVKYAEKQPKAVYYNRIYWR